MSLVEALLAVAAGDQDGALALAADAHKQGASLLAPALSGYLAASRHAGVYDEPTAFTEFIDNGSNPVLYARTIEMLGDQHRSHPAARVLDIGCGDGRVTRSVLQPATDTIDLVEPSAELLSTAAGACESLGRWVGAHECGITEFLDRNPDEHWDVTQSTFALHTLALDSRREVLTRLAEQADAVIVVEFDVPDFADRSGEHAAYAVQRYERGVAEYADHPRVVSGFLMPVLVGQFDPERPRLTFEQPIEHWRTDLFEAGFESVSVFPVADYWWASASMLVAR